MKFKVEIECGNDAFQPNPDKEVARILQAVTYSAERGFFKYVGDELVLYDLNGNRVGVAKFEPE